MYMGGFKHEAGNLSKPRAVDPARHASAAGKFCRARSRLPATVRIK
jgi:hypothetical protein